jgi:riboflavin kinase/FMN adenylyltransferase
VITVDGVDDLPTDVGRLFIVVGVFDGLHRGHLYLLEQLRAAAAERRALPAVITFDHHPDEILRGIAPPLLCDPAERLERLAKAGVNVTAIQHFDEATRRTPYDAFVRRIANRVDLAGFLMTPDAAFGFERGGTPETLAILGRELGFDVAVVPALLLNGRRVSSSDIRAAIERGDLREAEALLGRRYRIVGRRRGREAGDATALDFEMPVTLPPNGDYEVRVECRDPDGEVGATLRIDGEVRIQGRVPEADRYAVTFW